VQTVCCVVGERAQPAVCAGVGASAMKGGVGMGGYSRPVELQSLVGAEVDRRLDHSCDTAHGSSRWSAEALERRFDVVRVPPVHGHH